VSISAAKWTAQSVGWLATIVVVRLPTPADYGIVGMATLYLGFVTLLSEFGIDAAVVTLRDLSHNSLRQVNTVALAVGFASLGLSFLVAPAFSRYFAVPELTRVVVAMSFVLPIGALRVVPQAVLQRNLQFRAVAVAEAAQAIGVAVLTVLLALLGFRYWTLVVGAIAGSIVSTSVILLRSRHGYMLATDVGVGVVVYAASLVLLHGARVRNLVRFARSSFAPDVA
jgi:O-antigen/teichoic acid export membrane protein